MSGSILRGNTSTSWINFSHGTGSIAYINTYIGACPVVACKTTNGAWGIGAYSNNTLNFAYGTDANYNAGTNTAAVITFNSAGGASFPSDVSSSGMISAGRIATGYDAQQSGSVSCSNWFRSSGNTGWYNATYGGGWYMIDTSWIRAYADKNVYTPGEIQAGTLRANGWCYVNVLNSSHCINAGTTAKTNCYIDTAGSMLKTSTTSSKRFKDDITTDLPEELNPEKLYNIDVVSFKYKENYFINKDDIRYRKDMIGFIAENIFENYPMAADYHFDENGEVVVDAWNDQYLIPAMLKLIQLQNDRIKALEKQNEEA